MRGEARGLEGRKGRNLRCWARDFDCHGRTSCAPNRTAITRLLRDIFARNCVRRWRACASPSGWRAQPAGDAGRQDGTVGARNRAARQPHQPGLEAGAPCTGSDAHFEREEEFDLDEVVEQVVRDANYEGAVKGLQACALFGRGRTPKSTVIANCLGSARRERAAQRGALIVPGTRRWTCPIERPALPWVRRPPDCRADAVVDHHTRSRPGAVPAGDLERIFEPFYRVAESRDRDSGGEGYWPRHYIRGHESPWRLGYG